jgi:WD40 repeat protein
MITDIVFSPDGRYVATASFDHTARIWEVSQGRQIAILTHEKHVQAVDFSPDGHYIATASTDHTTRVWGVPQGNPIALITHDSDVQIVKFSPNGKYLATAHNETAGIWLWRIEDLVEESQKRLTRNLTAEEWEIYINDLPYSQTDFSSPRIVE